MPANQPPNHHGNNATPPSAADMIRAKVDQIYTEEPDANTEFAESVADGHHSKHQKFMYELGTSGKDLATIQTEWHNYYQALPEAEKHQVWQEFYSSQSVITKQPAQAQLESPQTLSKHKQPAKKRPKQLHQARSKQDLQAAIKHKVTAGGKLETKHHIQSLLFGLGIGLIVILIFLFGFFNEVVITPFIQPSRVSSATPLIVSTDSVSPTDQPQVIIPKINVQIPVDYNQTSTAESVIENALEDGVVHYPTTSKPGEDGNTAIFGHSSNNIFNKGKYKFAFVLLHTLVEGDTFYLTYNGKVYVYKVISRTVVDPSNVSVLGPVSGKKATATLITCDPPGTSLHRLVVVGEQVSPDPSTNSSSSSSSASSIQEPAALPGNGPTLWGRIMSTAIGKLAAVSFLVVAALVVVRWVNKRVHEWL